MINSSNKWRAFTNISAYGSVRVRRSKRNERRCNHVLWNNDVIISSGYCNRSVVSSLVSSLSNHIHDGWLYYSGNDCFSKKQGLVGMKIRCFSSMGDDNDDAEILEKARQVTKQTAILTENAEKSKSNGSKTSNVEEKNPVKRKKAFDWTSDW